MKIKTNSLDVAGFFYATKGKLLGINGKYPRNEYIMDVSRLAIWYERYGLINYRWFIKHRHMLKNKARKTTIPYTVTGMTFEKI